VLSRKILLENLMIDETSRWRQVGSLAQAHAPPAVRTQHIMPHAARQAAPHLSRLTKPEPNAFLSALVADPELFAAALPKCSEKETADMPISTFCYANPISCAEGR
jgi:hypothetical protein